MKLTLYSDGGARGNPGPAAYGFVVYDSAGNILEKCGKYLGYGTNNYAEYQGVIAGLSWLKSRYSGAALTIYLDSLLIVNQLKGIYKVKTPTLQPLFLEARELLCIFPVAIIAHVPRAQNTVADSLVNLALDQVLTSRL